MIKKLLFVLLTIFNYSYSQNTLGTTEVTTDVSEGYTLFTVWTGAYLINNCGEVVNEWTSSFPPGNAVYLLENGNLLRAGRTASTDITFGGQGGVIELYNWDGDLLWQYFYDTPMMRQHHDIFPMPNGNVLILAATRMTNAEAIQAGRNPALLSETDLYNEQIIEVTPVGLSDVNVVWEWNIKDHLVQDFDSNVDNFGNVGQTPSKLDINFLNGGSGGSNWLHINSIQYNPELDQIVLSSRNLSEIFIIDHSTTTAEAASDTGGTYGKGGDLLYRWGNPQSYRQGTATDRKLFGQHYPYVIESGLTDEGKIILYNNGNGRSPSFSEVFIINPETTSPGVYTYVANTAYGPENPDYIYTDPVTPTDFYSSILSSAQRLPNGNTLICEGASGHFFEITPTEEIVWEYYNPIDSVNGNIATQEDDPTTFPNLSFRALKYMPDYAGLIGRDLTPIGPIEMNPNIASCLSILDVVDFEDDDFIIYPNPVISDVHITTNLEITNIEVYSSLGKRVLESSRSTINLSEQSSGLYFLKIYTATGAITKKLIKK